MKIKFYKTNTGYNSTIGNFAIVGVGATKNEATQSLKECLKSCLTKKQYLEVFNSL